MAIEFEDPIVAGTVLVRELIRSQDFIAGVSGWAIYANGDAEFSDLIARGTFSTGSSGRRVVITDDPEPSIRMYSGSVDEVAPAFLEAEETGSSIQTRLSGGDLGGGAALLILSATATGNSALLSADHVTLGADGFLINVTTADDWLGIVDADGQAVIVKYDSLGINPKVWTAPTLKNSWVNFGGSSPNAAVRLYPDGDAALRGVVKNGTNQIIMTLDAEYRPPVGDGYEVPISGGRGRLIINANGDVTISGLPAGSTTFTELHGRWSTLPDGS